MDELIVVLILVAVYALAAIAYRYPSGYQKIVWPLMAISVAASLGINVWNMSSAQAGLALFPFISDDKVVEAMAAARAVAVSFDVALLIVVAAPVYLMILLALPFLRVETKGKWGSPQNAVAAASQSEVTDGDTVEIGEERRSG